MALLWPLRKIIRLEAGMPKPGSGSASGMDVGDCIIDASGTMVSSSALRAQSGAPSGNETNHVNGFT